MSRSFHLYLGILSWKAKGEVTELLFCEVILKAGEKEDSPVVDPDWLEVLLCRLLLPRHHLEGVSEGLQLLSKSRSKSKR